MALGASGSFRANPYGIDAVTGAAPANSAQASFQSPYGISPPVNRTPSLSSSLHSLVSKFDKSNASKQLSDYNFYAAGSGSSGAAPVSDGYAYYNAKLASIYGMDRATAYQEALANTAYQRAVEDLKAAGLNPVLAAGKVRGADNFYGTVDSSGSGGSRSGYSGSRSSGGHSASGFLKGALKDYNVRSGISSVVSGITMAATKNFQAGAASYYFSNALLNAVAKR